MPDVRSRAVSSFSQTQRTYTKTGIAKRWVADRGFGFITANDGSGDIFVHYSGIADGRRELCIGDEVEFNIASDVRTGKLQASEVRVIG